MASMHRMRLYNDSISWDGGKTFEQFEWASMSDIEFYLSKIRIE